MAPAEHLQADDASASEKTAEGGDKDGLGCESFSTADAKAALANVNPDDDFPDGGFRAWSVVAGVVAGNSATFGYVNAWGVFQAYYEQNTLNHVNASTMCVPSAASTSSADFRESAWIGSIQYSLIFFPSLITGRLFDLGYFQGPLAVSSVILIAATFLVAQCKEYYQFLLCQGILTGVCCGVIFGPNLGLVGHWFKRKRGLAMGIAASGSSIGGTVFPIATHKLIPLVGFKWTMRICAFMLLFCLAIANLTLRRRLPPKNVAGGLLNLKAFKSASYTIWSISSLVAFLGLYTVLTYIDVSAQSFGISPEYSFYLIAIANGSSVFGRLGGGIISDRTGPMNVLIPSTLLSAVVTFVWPHVRTQGGLTAIAVIYGMLSGVYVSLFAVPLFELGEISDLGRRTGMTLTMTAIGALAGPPISGAVNTATGGYTAVGYYAGSAIVLCVILMLITRHLVLKRLWGKI
ncbi:unnamed protein product [Mycena citricolor]|uniref:Major facilitator superfamily (MFS) profile domain-containing protein n=1 Tax=Mycena citricolor TaxID=2018698 RepID=A0AAD2H207_9AGAR|nr:unnamed protein product [Mycena citricolor]